MFTFRVAPEDGKRLARRIRRLLQGRHAMHIGELRMRLGTDEASVQAEWEEMMGRERSNAWHALPTNQNLTWNPHCSDCHMIH